MLWMLYVKSICRIAHDERCALVAESALEQLERALLVQIHTRLQPLMLYSCFTHALLERALLVLQASQLWY